MHTGSEGYNLLLLFSFESQRIITCCVRFLQSAEELKAPWKVDSVEAKEGRAEMMAYFDCCGNAHQLRSFAH